MVEKAYKAMNASGAASIAIGVTILVTGVVAGILSIVFGARLLKNRHYLTF